MYKIEIYNRSGERLADISTMCTSRGFTQDLNRHDTQRVVVNLDKFEELARNLGTDVDTLVGDMINEIRFTRQNKVITAGIIVKHFVYVNSRTIQIYGLGWSWLFSKMHVPEDLIFEDETYGNMIWGLIDAFQSQGANYDFGFTQGNINTTGLHDGTFRTDKNIGDAIEQVTELENGPDIYVTPDKVVHVYDHRGSTRPDIINRYPGNVTDLDLLIDGQEMANYQIALGAGTGNPLREIAEAVTEEGIYGVLQEKNIYNDVQDQDVLQRHAQGDVDYSKSFMIMVDVTVDGIIDPVFGSYDIGDTVYFKVTSDLTSLNRANGYMRIEGFAVDIEQEDQEVIRVKATK